MNHERCPLPSSVPCSAHRHLPALRDRLCGPSTRFGRPETALTHLGLDPEVRIVATNPKPGMDGMERDSPIVGEHAFARPGGVVQETHVGGSDLLVYSGREAVYAHMYDLASTPCLPATDDSMARR